MIAPAKPKMTRDNTECDILPNCFPDSLPKFAEMHFGQVFTSFVLHS